MLLALLPPLLCATATAEASTAGALCLSCVPCQAADRCERRRLTKIRRRHHPTPARERTASTDQALQMDYHLRGDNRRSTGQLELWRKRSKHRWERTYWSRKACRELQYRDGTRHTTSIRGIVRASIYPSAHRQEKAMKSFLCWEAHPYWQLQLLRLQGN